MDLDVRLLPEPLLFWARPVAAWPLPSALAFAAAVALALEGVALATTAVLEAACSPAARTPPGARPRHRLDCADFACTALNKLATVAFLVHVLRDLHAHAPPPPPSARSALLPVPLLFLAYDAMYAPFHCLLHWAPLYPFIHKHHHRQVAPHRGLDDAVNTHPIEYAVGMWMHLGALWLLRDGLGLAVSPWAVLLFVLGGSVLAAVNHTRMEVEIPFLFNSREHDTHHRFSLYNYARACAARGWWSYSSPSLPRSLALTTPPPPLRRPLQSTRQCGTGCAAATGRGARRRRGRRAPRPRPRCPAGPAPPGATRRAPAWSRAAAASWARAW